MAWKNLVAHKVTLGYLNLRYGVSITALLKDPMIRELPFYNQEAPPDMLRQDVNKFAGEFITYLANLNFTLESGKTLNSADRDLLETAIDGGNPASGLGDVVDANFLFSDGE